MTDQSYRTKPDKVPTKEDVKDYMANATPGERKALDQAATYIANWQTDPGTAWFGKSINPDEIWGKCLEAGDKFNVEHAAYKFLFYNPMKRAERA